MLIMSQSMRQILNSQNISRIYVSNNRILVDVVGVHDPIIIGEYPDYNVASEVMIELFSSIPYCDTIRIPLLDEVEKFCSR
jgi:hypothetical protein